MARAEGLVTQGPGIPQDRGGRGWAPKTEERGKNLVRSSQLQAGATLGQTEGAVAHAGSGRAAGPLDKRDRDQALM